MCSSAGVATLATARALSKEISPALNTSASLGNRSMAWPTRKSSLPVRRLSPARTDRKSAQER